MSATIQSTRLSITKNTLRQLFAHSGNRCAFPGCERQLVKADGTFVAQVCHIEGVRGERFNPSQTDEERRSASNLMLMCHEHHIVTDDEKTYTVEVLREYKSAHEQRYVQAETQISEEVLETALSQINQQLSAIITKIEKVESTTDLTLKKVEGLEGMVAKLIFDRMGANDPDIMLYHLDQLSNCETLFKQKKYLTGITLLRNYKKKFWKNFSDDFKIKFTQVLAQAQFDIQEKKEAATEILDIEFLNDESPLRINLLTIAYSVLENEEKFNSYFSKSIEKTPNNIATWGAYILFHKNNPEACEAAIPPAIKNEPSIIYNLGETYLTKGNRKKGLELCRKYFELVEEGDETKYDLKGQLGTRLIENLSDPFKFFHQHYTIEEKLDVMEALKMLSEAWEELEKSDLASTRFYVAMHKGIALRLLEQNEESVGAFQIAYNLSKNCKTFHCLAIALLDLDRIAETQRLIQDYSQNGNDEENRQKEIIVIKSIILRNAGKPIEAVALTEEFLTDKRRESHTDLLKFMAADLLKGKDYVKLKVILEELNSINSASIFTHLMGAAISEKETKTVEQITFLDQAITLVNEKTEAIYIYMLAENLLKIGKYDSAAQLFGKIADLRIPNSLSRGLIISVYQSGNIEGALLLSEPLLASTPGYEPLAEIVFNIAMQTRNYHKAVEVVTNYLAAPQIHNKSLFNYKLAVANNALHKHAEALIAVNMVDDLSELNMVQCFNLAKVSIQAQDVLKGMEIAYKTREQYFENPKAHSEYLGLCVNNPLTENEIHPTSISTFCAVSLISENGRVEQYLISDIPSSDSVTRMNSKDPFTEKIVGKSTGDKIEVVKAFNQKSIYTVGEILTPGVFAMRETINLLDTKYSGQTGILVLDASKGVDSVFEVIRSISKENAEVDREMMELYLRRAATIGSSALKMQRSSLEQWMRIIGHPNIDLNAQSRSELHEAILALENKTYIICDIISLFTNFLLIDVNLIALLTNKLAVATSTLDELRAILENVRNKSPETTSIAYENGGYYKHNISTETIENQKQKLEAIITWCEKNCEILTPNNLLKLNAKDLELRSSILGDSSLDSILLAKELDGVLFSDDDLLKYLSSYEYKVNAFGSIQLVQQLRSRQIINDEQANKTNEQLTIASYINIPCNTEILWSMFDRSGYKLAKPFTTAIKSLQTMSPFFAAVAISGFLKKLYLTSGLESTRTVVMIALAEVIKSSAPKLKEILLAQIQNDFWLLPEQLREVLGFIRSI